MKKYGVYDVFVHFTDDGESITKETKSWVRIIDNPDEVVHLPIKFGELYFKGQVQYSIDINNLNLTEEGKRKLFMASEMQNVVSTNPNRDIYVYRRFVYKLDDHDLYFELPGNYDYYKTV